jgi:hypothetical protein
MDHVIPGVHRGVRARESNPAYQGYQILHAAFVLLPALAGLDKFFHYLADWDQYLAPQIEKVLPMSAHAFMVTTGIVEVLAAVVVAIKPRIGAWMVSAWLLGIIVNLLLAQGYYDIVLRDVGLLLGSVALARLATVFEGGRVS